MEPYIPNAETLMMVLPELILMVGMCAVVLVPMVGGKSKTVSAAVTLLFLGLAGAAVFPALPDDQTSFQFANMLTIDAFSQFIKLLVIGFTILVVAQWLIATKQGTAELDTPDFMCLLLGAAFGMSLMASANNLLMIFVAMEAASFPSFALAGFRKRHKIGSEGALKYVIFGAASSAVMIYGMSLVYGGTGSLDVGTIASITAVEGMSPMVAIGMLAMFAGFAFKLSAVPMHFWCPDVFEGAPTEVTTFLSVASKGAAIALLVRFLHEFGTAGAAAAADPKLDVPATVFVGLMVGVATLGAVTATWGNLVAFHQNNVKRLLAYSSIAHAGYMIMGASVMVLAGRKIGGGDGVASSEVAGAILFYIFVYVFMNMGAFTVAALVAKATGTEALREYAGMSKRSPALAALMTVFLMSLFGLPGLGGFLGKVYLGVAMIDIGAGGFALLAALLLNTLVSLYYYMRPVYYMYFVKDEADRPTIVPPGAGMALLGICALMLVWTGLNGAGLRDFGKITNEYGVLHAATPAVEQPVVAEPTVPNDEGAADRSPLAGR